MLKDLPIQSIYRNINKDTIAEEFLIPCLKKAIRYDRGCAYFSIYALLDLFKGLVPLIKNDGKIRCITSVELSEQDKNYLTMGYSLSQEDMIEKIKTKVHQKIELASSELEKLDIITNLIAANLLEIRIAYMQNALYHEKIGFIIDEEGNTVYFSGSANETLYGLNNNRESINVFTSWNENSADDIKKEIRYFNNLWLNKDPQVRTFSFPEALKNDLFNKYKKSDGVKAACSEYSSDNPYADKRSQSLRDYQREAVENYLVNDGKYFFQMATGTGKTFTAIHAILELINQKNKNFLVLILVPLKDLQTQWAEELNHFNIEPMFIGGLGNDISESQVIISAKNAPKSTFAICVYNTFFSSFHKKIKNISNLIMVADEAHNLGPSRISKMPKHTQYRLGLSATPERYYEHETKQILNYFLNKGTNPFLYGLKEAIDNEFLSHYIYEPIFIHLNEDEMNDFNSYSTKIAQTISALKDDPEALEKMKQLIFKRSSIIKQATDKLDVLFEMTKNPKYDFTKAVVYCGQGTKDQEDVELRIIDLVLKRLSANPKLTISSFIDSTPNRPQLLDAFRRGDISTLVAIKCFDEGIDVPFLERLFVLASDTTKRQTIQRRGRVLRVCKETGKDIARIYDMIALPPKHNYEITPSIRKLITSELVRFKSYSELADNEEMLNKILSDIETKFSIMPEDYLGWEQENQI